MLDKKRVKTWVKVVAWSLAVVFGTSFSFLFMMPTAQQGGSTSKNSPTINASDSEKAQSLAGQAEVAQANDDFDQAIQFYEQALALDDANEEFKSGLALAYYEKGKEVQSEDATAANDAFTRYLEVLPDGPKAAEVRELLDPTE